MFCVKLIYGFVVKNAFIGDFACLLQVGLILF